MIELKNITFSYERREQGGLRNINLTVKNGECILLCGRSGCGKTTITRLVNGLIPRFYDGELTGQVVIDGKDIAEALGMCGTVSFLLRTRSGKFVLNDAITLEEISDAPFEHILPIEVAVEHFPELILTDKQALRISQGVVTSISGVSEGKYRLKTAAGLFIGIGSANNGMVKAEKVINPLTQM